MGKQSNNSAVNNENMLQIYLQQVNSYKLLTQEEELDIVKRIENNDEFARKQLIEANLRLVILIAKIYIKHGMTFTDLIQEGNLGLIQATYKYDYHREVRFSTYAAWWIRQSITRALENKKNTIRIPHNRLENLKKIQNTYYRLSQNFMRVPTLPEIAEDLNISLDKLNNILNSDLDVTSLDININSESNETLHNIHEDYSYSPEEQLFKKLHREELYTIMEYLSEREQAVLKYRYGFHDGSIWTLKSIAQVFNVSSETIRQIEFKAVRKLQSYSHEIIEIFTNH